MDGATVSALNVNKKAKGLGYNSLTFKLVQSKKEHILIMHLCPIAKVKL